MATVRCIEARKSTQLLCWISLESLPGLKKKITRRLTNSRKSLLKDLLRLQMKTLMILSPRTQDNSIWSRNSAPLKTLRNPAIRKKNHQQTLLNLHLRNYWKQWKRKKPKPNQKLDWLKIRLRKWRAKPTKWLTKLSPLMLKHLLWANLMEDFLSHFPAWRSWTLSWWTNLSSRRSFRLRMIPKKKNRRTQKVTKLQWFLKPLLQRHLPNNQLLSLKTSKKRTLRTLIELRKTRD